MMNTLTLCPSHGLWNCLRSAETIEPVQIYLNSVEIDKNSVTEEYLATASDGKKSMKFIA